MSLLVSKKLLVSGIGIGIVVLIALTQSVHAGAECASLGGACDDGGWDPMQKLDEIGDTMAGQEPSSAKWPEKSRIMRWDMSDSGLEDERIKSPEPLKNTEESQAVKNDAPIKAGDDPASMVRSDKVKAILAPLDSVTDSDILLDVSENSSAHIAGSVVIPYMEFDVDAGVPKPVAEISKILGDAGISREDSVVIYGECLPCGGGPSVATYVYWLMKGLGHKKLRVLDGTAVDWAASGRSIANDANILPSKIYTPAETANFSATYEFVRSGRAQVVDARTSQEHDSGSIPGSISIPCEAVLEGKRIKGEEQLSKVFMLLDRDKPVVVFTNTGMKASVIWFALEMMSYDARRYSWRDWQENQPEFNLELIDVDAKPNPVISGSTTTITASFRKKQLSSLTNSSDREMKLTIKGVGCSTCGFEGFSLGSANLAGNKSGFVQLGSSSGLVAQPLDNALRCTASINSPGGSEVLKTSLLRTSGDKYMGMWNAKVTPGVYKLSIVANASGIEKIFSDVLEIVVEAKRL